MKRLSDGEDGAGNVHMTRCLRTEMAFDEQALKKTVELPRKGYHYHMKAPIVVESAQLVGQETLGADGRGEQALTEQHLTLAVLAEYPVVPEMN